MTYTVRDELKRLSRLHRGRLKPEHVVEEARAKKSPLHSHFDWSDTVAARKWRLHQARNLLLITVEYSEELEDSVKMFVSLKTERSEGYRLVADVISCDELREQMLRDALQDMRVFQQKYRLLSELAQVFDAMQSVLVK